MNSKYLSFLGNSVALGGLALVLQACPVQEVGQGVGYGGLSGGSSLVADNHGYNGFYNNHYGHPNGDHPHRDDHRDQDRDHDSRHHDHRGDDHRDNRGHGRDDQHGDNRGDHHDGDRHHGDGNHGDGGHQGGGHHGGGDRGEGGRQGGGNRGDGGHRGDNGGHGGRHADVSAQPQTVAQAPTARDRAEFVAGWAQTFKMSPKSANKMITALEKSEKNRNLDALAQLGIDNRDAFSMARFDLPSPQGIQALAVTLDQNPNDTREMLQKITTRASDNLKGACANDSFAAANAQVCRAI